MYLASMVAQLVKNPLAMQEISCNEGDLCSILGREDPLEKEMATHSVSSPGKSHVQRILDVYSSLGRKRWT